MRFRRRRAVFDEVDAALGEKLSALIWGGPERGPDADGERAAGADGGQPGGGEGARDRIRREDFAGGVRGGAFAWRILRAGGGWGAVGHRRGKAPAQTRPGDAGGRSGRAGRHGGADRQGRCRDRGDDRAGGIGGRHRGGRQRQQCRQRRHLGHEGRGRSRHRGGEGQGRAGDPAAGVRALPLAADGAGRDGDGAGAGGRLDSASRLCRSSPT